MTKNLYRFLWTAKQIGYQVGNAKKHVAPSLDIKRRLIILPPTTDDVLAVLNRALGTLLPIPEPGILRLTIKAGGPDNLARLGLLVDTHALL